jgi:hypothetical protein
MSERKQVLGALTKLVHASESVAHLQPAAYAKDQAEADRWGRFYEAVK